MIVVIIPVSFMLRGKKFLNKDNGVYIYVTVIYLIAQLCCCMANMYNIGMAKIRLGFMLIKHVSCKHYMLLMVVKAFQSSLIS